MGDLGDPGDFGLTVKILANILSRVKVGGSRTVTMTYNCLYSSLKRKRTMILSKVILYSIIKLTVLSTII